MGRIVTGGTSSPTCNIEQSRWLPAKKNTLDTWTISRKIRKRVFCAQGITSQPCFVFSRRANYQIVPTLVEVGKPVNRAPDLGACHWQSSANSVDNLDSKVANDQGGQRKRCVLWVIYHLIFALQQCGFQFEWLIWLHVGFKISLSSNSFQNYRAGDTFLGA